MGVVLILIVVASIVAVGFPVWSPGQHVSDERIRTKVQEYVEQYLPTTPKYSDVRLTGPLTLTPTGGDTYVGRIQAARGDTPITLTVDITCDNDKLVWRMR
jgi:hypothetical protein